MSTTWPATASRCFAVAELRPDIGIIGGSGFYELIEDPQSDSVDTPYGPTSGPISRGHIGNRAVAFLPRHGPGHVLPPHRIPFRANLWALHQMGVTRVVAPCAVGSLRADVHPGDFVVCDQFVDRTSGRADTFFDGPDVSHVSMADPYCSELRSAAVGALKVTLAGTGHRAVDGGTVVVVQGPRFSTRAESSFYRAAGWDVINMTQYPEVTLARELGMCFCGVALVTDYDTGVPGVDDSEPVSMEVVFRVLASMVDTFREALRGMVERIPAERGCGCG